MLYSLLILYYSINFKWKMLIKVLHIHDILYTSHCFYSSALHGLYQLQLCHVKGCISKPHHQIWFMILKKNITGEANFLSWDFFSVCTWDIAIGRINEKKISILYFYSKYYNDFYFPKKSIHHPKLLIF